MAVDGLFVHHFVGTSEELRSLLRQLALISSAPNDVLITGEAGTGRSLAARTIHINGASAGGPLVGINCAAVPATLLESHLFGYETGAFAPFARRRVGEMERATGGTLVLHSRGTRADIPAETGRGARNARNYARRRHRTHSLRRPGRFDHGPGDPRGRVRGRLGGGSVLSTGRAYRPRAGPP
jgi:hypothetical protein